MVDEPKEEVKEEAKEEKAMAPAKSKVAEVSEKVTKATADLKLKLAELRAKYVVLEDKCKVQALALKESKSVKEARSFWQKIKDAFTKMRGIKAKKVIIDTTGAVIYGYIDSRRGDVVVVRDAHYLDANGPIAKLCSEGSGVRSKTTIYGLSVVHYRQVLEVSPAAAKVIG